MLEQKSFINLVTWPALMIVALVGYGLVAPPRPLHSPRPVDSAKGTVTQSNPARRSARLWQDPFKVDWARAGTDEPVTEMHAPVLSTEHGERWLVMPVMVWGKPFAEDAHHRLNSRFAVLTALGVAGFVPHDTNAMRGWAVKLTPSKVLEISNPKDAKDATSIVIPYETYESGPETPSAKLGTDSYDRVLVLWVSDDWVDPDSPDPAGLIKSIVGAIKKKPKAVALIGPTHSAYLIQMLQSDNWVTSDPHVTVHSPWATVTFDDLGSSASDLRERFLRARLAPDEPDTWLDPVIGQDEGLVDLLIEELGLRGVNLQDGRSHIALIAEGDTTYSRVFSSTVDRKLRARTGCNPNRIHLYTYLQGIDGSEPQQASGEANAEGGSKDLFDEMLRNIMHSREGYSQLERPEGRSQLDYLRRISRQLRRDSINWRKNQGQLVAIGLVGTDVYDKLLILQALRTSFPKAYFFTTDLDARLLHPAEYQWTRNLLIASHFGLGVDPELTRPYTVAPFRDGYQTAVFVATLRALGHPSFTNLKVPPAGRVFEVSRAGAFDLRGEPPGKKGRDPNYAPMGRRSWASASARDMILFITVVVLGGALLAFGSQSWALRSPEAPATEWRDLFTVGIKRLLIIVLPLLVLAGIALADSGRPNGEPLEFFLGISIWPTTILRLIACLLSVAYVKWSFEAISRSDDGIEGRFKISARSKHEKRTLAEFSYRWWRPRTLPLWWKHCTIVGWNAPIVESKAGGDDGRAIKFQKLWAQYRLRGMWRHRMLRTVLVLVMYLAFGVAVFLLVRDFPLVPYRGRVSAVCHQMVLIASVVLSNFLVFFVWDATRLCDRMVQWLTLFPTVRYSNVPEETLEQRVRQRCDAALNDVRIIADRTGIVGRIIYYPFVVLLIMIVARHDLFDNLHWNVPLAIVVSVSVFVVFISALTLRRTAWEGRSREVDQLRDLEEELNRANEAGDLPNDALGAMSGRIRSTIERIELIHEGALSRWYRNPVWGAVLLPIGGVGLVELLPLLVGRP